MVYLNGEQGGWSGFDAIIDSSKNVLRRAVQSRVLTGMFTD
jgi:hypothetical protein